MHRAGAVVLSFLVFLVVSSRSAQADCDRPRTVGPALSRAVLLFRGTVRDVRTIEKPDDRKTDRRGAGTQLRRVGDIVAFDVSTVWKGSVGRQLTLHMTALGEDDAFTPFTPGAEYLVFAEINSPAKSERFGIRGLTYGAHGCGGTGLVSQSAVYLRELGPGQPLRQPW